MATCWVLVNVKTNIIVDAAPIFKKFIGQKFSSLITWAKIDRIGKL